MVIAAPLTGWAEAAGTEIAARAETLVARARASSNAKPAPLRLFTVDVIDDQCTRAGAAAAATDVIARRPAVVIGHPCSAAAATAAPLYRAAGVLFLAAGARHPDITKTTGSAVQFRIAGRDDRQGEDAGLRLASFARAGAAGGIVIVHDRTILARSIADGAQRVLKARTGRGAEIVTIVASETDYSAAVAKIVASQPRAILFAGFPAEGVIVLRQLRERGATARFLAIDTHASASFIAEAGRLADADVEVMLPVPVAGQVAPIEAPTFEGIAVADVIAALEAWMGAVRLAGTPIASAVVHQLRHGGVADLGTTFDASGDARAVSFAPFTWRNGRWHPAGR